MPRVSFGDAIGEATADIQNKATGAKHKVLKYEGSILKSISRCLSDGANDIC